MIYELKSVKPAIWEEKESKEKCVCPVVPAPPPPKVMDGVGEQCYPIQGGTKSCCISNCSLRYLADRRVRSRVGICDGVDWKVECGWQIMSMPSVSQPHLDLDVYHRAPIVCLTRHSSSTHFD